jgi:hypothetical protein
MHECTRGVGVGGVSCRKLLAGEVGWRLMLYVYAVRRSEVVSLKQTLVFHAVGGSNTPDSTRWGDCEQACVSSLIIIELGLPLVKSRHERGALNSKPTRKIRIRDRNDKEFRSWYVA